MRRVLLALALLSPLAVNAQPAVPTQASSAGWLTRDTADLLILNKVDARPIPLSLKVGQQADNSSLSITLRGCVVRPPDQPADSAAFLDIADSRPGAPGFHGWIFASAPSVSMFEHPIYDVRLIGCHS